MPISSGATAINNSGAGTAAIVPLTGVATGDLMVLFSGTLLATAAPAVPAGWTDRGSAVVGNEAYRVCSRVKQAGDTTVSIGGAPALGATGAVLAAFHSAEWRETGAPVTNAAAGATIDPSALTMDAGSSWSLLIVGGGSTATAPFTYPGGWTESVFNSSNNTQAIAHAQPGAGSVDPGPITYGVSVPDRIVYHVEIAALGAVAIAPSTGGVSTASADIRLPTRIVPTIVPGVSTATITEVVTGRMPYWRSHWYSFLRGEGRATCVGVGDSLMEGYFAGPNAHTLDMWTTHAGRFLAAKANRVNASRYFPTEGLDGSGADFGPWAEADPAAGAPYEIVDPWTRTPVPPPNTPSTDFFARPGSGGLGERSMELDQGAAHSISAPSWATHAQIHYHFASPGGACSIEVRSNGVVVGTAAGSTDEARQMEVVLEGSGTILLITNTGTLSNINVDGVTWQDRASVPGIHLGAVATANGSVGAQAGVPLSGIADGFLMVLFAVITDDSLPGGPAAPAVPAGWTDRGSTTIGTTAYRICTKTKQASDTSVGIGGGGNGAFTVADVVSFGGAAWSEVGAVTALSTSAIDPPSININNTSSFSLLLVGSKASGTTFGFPTGWDSSVASPSTANACSAAIARRTGLSGPVDPAPIVLSQGPQNAAVFHAELVATDVTAVPNDAYVELLEGGHGGYSAASYVYGAGQAQHNGITITSTNRQTVPAYPAARPLADDPSNRWADAVALTNPHCVIMWLGPNDAQYDDTAADFVHNLTAMVTAIDAACATPPDLLWVVDFFLDLSDFHSTPLVPSTAYTESYWNGLADAMVALGESYGNRARVIDLRTDPRFAAHLPYPGTVANPFPGGIGGRNPIVSADGVHPNASGEHVFGDIIGQTLAEVPVAYMGPQSSGASTASMAMMTGTSAGPQSIIPHSTGTGFASCTLVAGHETVDVGPIAHGVSHATCRLRVPRSGSTTPLDGGPCPWPADSSCCPLIDTADEATVELLIEAATEILWAATGRQFGECAVTLRPCRRSCSDSGWGNNWISGGYGNYGFGGDGYVTPVLFDGQWFNMTCGGCGGDCSCGRVEEVVLPASSTGIIAVTIDGAELSPDAYRLDNSRLLVRQDGQFWPLCQDLSKPAGEVGTWTVEALFGAPVPAMGRVALAEMTCELIKACDNDPECRLPARLQTLTRQGVTQNFVDPKLFAGKGAGTLTGLWLVDRFIQAYNPNFLASRSQVYSPDLPKTRITE